MPFEYFPSNEELELEILVMDFLLLSHSNNVILVDKSVQKNGEWDTSSVAWRVGTLEGTYRCWSQSSLSASPCHMSKLHLSHCTAQNIQCKHWTLQKQCNASTGLYCLGLMSFF